MKKILIDTNAYSGLFSGHDIIFDTIGKAETIYMSVFVLGELFFGFQNGKKEQKNKQTLEQFLSKSTVNIINATIETSDIFGYLKTQLKKQGTPIPINDVWIASHAIETGSVLLTQDHHFEKISGLRIMLIK